MISQEYFLAAISAMHMLVESDSEIAHFISHVLSNFTQKELNHASLFADVNDSREFVNMKKKFSQIMAVHVQRMNPESALVDYLTESGGVSHGRQ